MLISAGHSNTDPGAVSAPVKDRNGRIIVPSRREADIAVEFRNIVSFYLSRAGIPHELDGHGTENIPLRDAARIARRHRIAVEFHCNSFHKPSAHGCEVLSSAEDVELAGRLASAVARGLNIYNRGAKPEGAGQHSRLAFIQAGGLIVELFFLSNPDDLAAYDARKWLAAREVAEVLASA